MSKFERSLDVSQKNTTPTPKQNWDLQFLFGLGNKSWKEPAPSSPSNLLWRLHCTSVGFRLICQLTTEGQIIHLHLPVE